MKESVSYVCRWVLLLGTLAFLASPSFAKGPLGGRGLSSPLGAQAGARKPAGRVKAPAGELDDDYGFYRFRFNTSLGMGIFHGTAFTIGEQFGFAPFANTPLYFGPAIDFALYSPGYLFSTLAGGWYELKIYGAPRLSLAMGALAGAAFTKSLSGVRNVALAGFIDTAIIQDIDDLFSVRGEFRPGVIDGNFAFLMNFDVSFRFP